MSDQEKKDQDIVEEALFGGFRRKEFLGKDQEADTPKDDQELSKAIPRRAILDLAGFSANANPPKRATFKGDLT